MRYIYLVFTLLFTLPFFAQNDLIGEWYLHSTTLNDVEELNTDYPNLNLQFTLDAGSAMSLDYLGTGVCNDYFGEYNFEGTDIINFISFNRTLIFCSTYEEGYFGFYIDSEPGTIIRNYAISGSGDDESLVMSRDNGDYVTFGRQTLSLDENSFNRMNVQLKENPVNSYLSLDFNEDLGNGIRYQIYSIDGKKIVEGQLNENKTIDVNSLYSGMYFLQVSTIDYSSQIIKFIKH